MNMEPSPGKEFINSLVSSVKATLSCILQMGGFYQLYISNMKGSGSLLYLNSRF